MPAKHVFCEKPMATSIEDGSGSLERRIGKQIGVSSRAQQAIRSSLYDTEQLSESGPAHSAHVKMNRGELINPEWVGDPQVTGGFLYETPIHMFDMMRFLFGEIASLDAAGSSHDIPRPMTSRCYSGSKAECTQPWRPAQTPAGCFLTSESKCFAITGLLLLARSKASLKAKVWLAGTSHRQCSSYRRKKREDMCRRIGRSWIQW